MTFYTRPRIPVIIRYKIISGRLYRVELLFGGTAEGTLFSDQDAALDKLAPWQIVECGKGLVRQYYGLPTFLSLSAAVTKGYIPYAEIPEVFLTGESIRALELELSQKLDLEPIVKGQGGYSDPLVSVWPG